MYLACNVLILTLYVLSSLAFSTENIMSSSWSGALLSRDEFLLPFLFPRLPLCLSDGSDTVSAAPFPALAAATDSQLWGHGHSLLEGVHQGTSSWLLNKFELGLLGSTYIENTQGYFRVTHWYGTNCPSLCTYLAIYLSHTLMSLIRPRKEVRSYSNMPRVIPRDLMVRNRAVNRWCESDLGHCD